MKNTPRKFISFLALVTAAFFTSCHNEDSAISEQESIVSDARKWFENNTSALEALKYTQAINWENAIILDNNGGQALEVPLKLIEGTSTNVVDDVGYKTYMRLLLIKNPDDSYKIFDIIYTTKDISFNSNDQTFNILDIGNLYSGYITIQKNDNTIAYSGEYEKGKLLGLHNYSLNKNTANRLICTYYVTVGPYTTCKSWVWYPDYTSVPSNNLPPGYMPGISGPINLNSPTVDPCLAAAKTTDIASNLGFLSAKSAIGAAGADGNEHSITLGTPGASGAYTNSAIKTNGNSNSVSVNESLSGAFAAIHNHPNNTALSSGDIYAAVILNTKNASFTTSFILTGGQTYAIVITNLTNAQNFVKTYPADLSPNYSPEFPNFIFDQIDYINSQIGNSIDSKTAAISSVLDKYEAGITLMKLGRDGKFTRFKIQKNPDGSYSSVPCK